MIFMRDDIINCQYYAIANFFEKIGARGKESFLKKAFLPPYIIIKRLHSHRTAVTTDDGPAADPENIWKCGSFCFCKLGICIY